LNLRNIGNEVEGLENLRSIGNEVEGLENDTCKKYVHWMSSVCEI